MDIARLRKITTLKNVGLSLEEISQVIDLYFIDGKELEAKEKVLQILKEHLDVIEKKIDELEQFKEELVSNISNLEWMIEQYKK